VQYRFYIFDITYTKKVLINSKSIIISVYQTLITFFEVPIPNKLIKTLMHNQISPFVVKISFLSYDYNVLGSFPRKTVFVICCTYFVRRRDTCICNVVLICVVQHVLPIFYTYPKYEV